jgi:hypothetical protein
MKGNGMNMHYLLYTRQIKTAMKNHDNKPATERKKPNSLLKTSIDFQVTKTFTVFALLLISMVMSSCEVIGGIFKAGVGVGVFIVIAIIAVIIALVMRAGKK